MLSFEHFRVTSGIKSFGGSLFGSTVDDRQLDVVYVFNCLPFDFSGSYVVRRSLNSLGMFFFVIILEAQCNFFRLLIAVP